MTTTAFETLKAGQQIDGTPFSPTRESIRDFCEASLDYNPLHLDDDYMQGSFGKTQFGGIIMHGMNNFGVITKMLTDWLYPQGGVQRRLETRWKIPVKPGDTITPRHHHRHPQDRKKPVGHAGRASHQPARRNRGGRRSHGRIPARRLSAARPSAGTGRTRPPRLPGVRHPQGV